MPADAVGYLKYYIPIANCQADDNQNYMLLIWIASCVFSALSLSFLFSTGRNKIVQKSTSSLKWNGFLLTQVVPLCFCLHFLSCEKGLRRDESSSVRSLEVAGLDQTGAQRQASGGPPMGMGLLARGLCFNSVWRMDLN